MQYNNLSRPIAPSQPKQIVSTPPQPSSRADQVRILREKFQEAFQNRLRGNTAIYSQLVTHFGNLKGNSLSCAYEALAHCAASVDESFTEFLELIFRPNIAKVLYQKGEIVEAYNNMVVSLLSTHPNYLQHALKLVTTHFKPISEYDLTYLQASKDLSPVQLETLQLLEQNKYENIHLLLNLITKKLPNSLPNLVKRLEQEYPYHTQALSKHRAYVLNILRIVEYCPQLLNNIFLIVVQQLIKLDSEIKVDRDEEEEEEDDEEEEEFTMSQTQMFEFEDMREDVNEEHRQIIMAEKLDTIIYLVLSFVQQQSKDRSKIDILFQSMMRMFHSFVVNTYQLHSIQFLMFYICSFNEKYISNFVQFLLNKVFDQQLHQEVRKCCAAYLSGFISRAKYCSVQTVIAALGRLLAWADSYVQTFERTVTYLDVESHSIFYSICQGVFYVLCYKIDEIMKSENGVQFLQNEAPIAKIVRSKFNPFKVCDLFY
jgi:RNA polymerase I-specific transcription initiation factor RRN3